MTPDEEGESVFAPGQHFGPYVLDRLLGRGAFGVVYEARRPPLHKRVALKVLHEKMAGRGEAVARFVREAELVARFEHPHIVGVFDVGTHEGVPFLAMEYLEGETLEAKLVREGAQPIAAVLSWALPILSALAVGHDHRGVHRDLKPENIFLTQLSTGEVQPKLLDFGIAKVRESAQALTRTNALMGTPHYMSPEQAQESKHIDARSDQWSFAVILYRSIAGRSPFRGESLLGLLTAIATAPIAPLSSLVAGVPAGFELALARAMEREPGQRFPSLRDLARSLIPYADASTRARWSTHFGADQMPERPLPTTPSMAPTIELAGGAGEASTLRMGTGTVPLGTGPTGTLLPEGGTLQPQAHTLEPWARRPRPRPWIGAGVALVVVAVVVGIFKTVARSQPADPPIVRASATAMSARVEPPPAPARVEPPPAPARVAPPAVPSADGSVAVAGPSTAVTPVVATPPAEAPRRRTHRPRPPRRGERPPVAQVTIGTIGARPGDPLPVSGTNNIGNR